MTAPTLAAPTLAAPTLAAPTLAAPAAAAPVSTAALDLLAAARRTLVQAQVSTTSDERYVAAHLCALRAAAAVLASRSTPAGRRSSRVQSVWALLPRAAAELGEWAQFFSLTARRRAAIEAGLTEVSAREADDLVRDAEAFLVRVADHLRLPYQASVSLQGAG